MTELRILYLLSEGFGGVGGIAQYNRDMIEALALDPAVKSVEALPRLAHEAVGLLPRKVSYDLIGVGSVARYCGGLLKVGLSGPSPDLVICGHVNLLPGAWAVARARRVPLMLLVFGIDVWAPNRNPLVNRLIPYVDLVASISQVTLTRMRRWASVPEERTVVLPNAIRIADYGSGPKSADLIERYRLGGKRIVMTMGRIAAAERYKGFDQMLEAMPALIARHTDLVYLIAGDGDDRPRLEAKADALGLSDSVRFVGRIAEERKADHFRLADVYAMPSSGEGFGFVILEALACGVPVVASKDDGGFEAICEGALGLAVSHNDIDGIVEATSRQLYTPKGVPAALSYFSFDNFTKRLHATVGRLTARAEKAIACAG